MRIESKKIVLALFFPALFVLVLWLILLLETGLDAEWHRWGVYPRTLEGLRGVLASPLIHSSAEHLFSNSLPLLVLGWCLFYFYRDISFLVFFSLWAFSGIFTWLLGRESWHIGASGLIYAMSFFLFFSGIIRKYIPLIAVSLLVAFLYGSLVWDMLPITELVDPKISWEGHLAGAISGFLCAMIFRKYGPQKPIEPEEDEEEEPDEEPAEEPETTLSIPPEN